MAEHLASIFGTEKDRVNCPFYFKIGCGAPPPVMPPSCAVSMLGPCCASCLHMSSERLTRCALCPFRRACRHGDRCSRIHNKPTISQTILLQNMYQNPAMSMPPGPDGLPPAVDPRVSQEHFEVRRHPQPHETTASRAFRSLGSLKAARRGL